jgi:hypothetical protein
LTDTISVMSSIAPLPFAVEHQQPVSAHSPSGLMRRAVAGHVEACTSWRPGLTSLVSI